MARKIRNPHDRFMKALLSDLEMARDYFTQFLPEPLKEIVNLSGLSHSGTSFISGMKEGEFFADMVFECPLKSGQGKLYLSILVEHKSFKNKYVYIQLGRYLFGAYEQQLKAKSESLTPVIPFLYYHGGEVWHPENMHQFFRDYPAVLLDYIPEFKIIFRNIGDYTEEQLLQLGNAMLASALTTQKYSHDPTRLLTQVRTIFSTLESWMGRNLFENLLFYYFELVELKEEKLIELIDKVPEVMKTAFISTADRIRQRGMKEGTQQTKKQVVQNMLREGLEVAFICKILEVSPEFVEQVRKEMEV